LLKIYKVRFDKFIQTFAAKVSKRFVYLVEIFSV